MIDRDRDGSVGELARGGFEVDVRPVVGINGRSRINLTARGPYGAFVVSAPTEAEAYRAAVDQVRHMVPVHLPGRARY